MKTRTAWQPHPFRPYPGLTNPHLQTIVSNALRTTAGLHFHRHRLETPDGDFLDLDFPEFPHGIALTGDAPVVLVLHGLEGSARRGYTCQLYRFLLGRGIRPVGLNFRSCSGELNRTALFYHAGETNDVSHALAFLDDTFPTSLKGLAGFSLGGNVALKLLGEFGMSGPASLVAAAAISPPFNLIAGSLKLLRPPGLWYSRRFLMTLFAKVRAKRDLLEQLIDVDRALAARTLVEFDEHGTAPLNGFSSANDYYRRTSCGPFLTANRRPTLIIRAQDDPLMSSDDIHVETIAKSPALTGLFPRRGGHVGFAAAGGGLRFWAEEQAASFLAHHLDC